MKIYFLKCIQQKTYLDLETAFTNEPFIIDTTPAIKVVHTWSPMSACALTCRVNPCQEEVHSVVGASICMPP